MKAIASLYTIVGLFTALATVGVRADVISNFDDGTLDGWTFSGNAAEITNPGTGGNPGGYIQRNDLSGGKYQEIIAPSKFLGDWRNKLYVSADLKQASYGGTQWATVRFIISGPGGKYYRSFRDRPGRLWKNFKVDVSSTQWARSYGSWDKTISNVTRFTVLVDFIAGKEVNGVDNVALMDSAAPVSIDNAKQLPDGNMVICTGIVTRVLPDCIYMQSEDRVAGIRVNGKLAVNEAALITVKGTLGTSHRERSINNPQVVSSTPATMPEPIGVSLAGIGGYGKTAADPTLGISPTPKETGLLIKTMGVVANASPDGTFDLVLGKDLVSCDCGPGVAVPVPGAMVTLVGISSAGYDPARPVFLLVHDDCVVNALPYGKNVIRNPYAEEGPCGVAGEEVRPMPGWTTTPGITATAYGYIYPPEESVLIDGGRSFFFGGLNTANSSAYQWIDLSSMVAQIDVRNVIAELSGYMGGRGTEGDYSIVYAYFYDQNRQVTFDKMTLGPQSVSGGHLKYWKSVKYIAPGTRWIKLLFGGGRKNGSNNDQYFDNLSFVLTKYK